MKQSVLLLLTIASGLWPAFTPAVSASDPPPGIALTDKGVLAHFETI
jgi:hypothetical protein